MFSLARVEYRYGRYDIALQRLLRHIFGILLCRFLPYVLGTDHFYLFFGSG